MKQKIVRSFERKKKVVTNGAI